MRKLLALVAAITMLIIPSAQGNPAPRRTDFHGCGSIPSLTSWSIEAKRVRCHRARQVVRAYVAAFERDGNLTQDVLGFHCKLAGTHGEDSNYRCAAEGHRVIRFSRGG